MITASRKAKKPNGEGLEDCNYLPSEEGGGSIEQKNVPNPHLHDSPLFSLFPPRNSDIISPLGWGMEQEGRGKIHQNNEVKNSALLCKTWNTIRRVAGTQCVQAGW